MFNQENVLIPFSVSELPEGPWLIFAPHADDETFGMGGTLLRAKEQGIETHLIVLTDGSLGGDTPNLKEVRQNEVAIASELLGFKSIHSWSEPDRFLYPNNEVILQAIKIIARISPAAVFFPGALEIHPDHRATAYIVWESLRQLRPGKETPKPIAYEIGVQNPINLLIDITDQKSKKDLVMQVYKSQNKENNYPELVSALDKGRTFSLPKEVKYAEGFFRFQDSDLNSTLDSAIHSIIDLYQKIY
tara:strand:- start:825 stop:1562 length:738 start_codon:yes stop_codon:yes gene_type:complete